ncbi:MAG: tetratricopeptide repeat protein [Kiritimatiellia bacterium]
MNQPLKKDTVAPDQVPSRIPEDLIPIWLWLKDNGTQWLVTIAVAVLLSAGVAVYFRHRDSQTAEAAQQLLAQPTIETLEKAVADYGSTPPGAAVKLKLAKAYCDAGLYEKALEAYDEFIKNHASYPFADVAHVGRGFALFGLKRTEEAIEVFRAFRMKNPSHFLAPQTTFGEAACLTLQGKKDAAKALLQDLRADKRDTPWDAAAKRMEGAIERYQGGSMRSLLDQANALAPVTTPPVPAPVAVPAPAATPTTPAPAP